MRPVKLALYAVSGFRRGNITALQALRKSGGDPHQRDPVRATPLMFAVAFSAMDLIQVLLDTRTEL